MSGKGYWASGYWKSKYWASGYWAGVGVEIVAIPPDQLRLTLELYQSFGVQVALHKSLGLQSDLHKSIQLTLER